MDIMETLALASTLEMAIGMSVETRRFCFALTAPRTAILTGWFLASLIQPGHGLLAQDSEGERQDSTAENREDIEEIVVTAPRTLNSMRTEIVAAQDRALAIFNEINLDNDYDVACRRETPLGSHIPQRVCRPRFVDRLESEASQDFLSGDLYFDPSGEIMYHNDILKQKLASLAVEHPGLYQALQEYYLLQTEYESEREERFRDSWFAR